MRSFSPLAASALRQERATSLVEFTLILPLLLTLTLGVLDLGRGLNTYLVLTNAAREGVYWLATRPLDTAGALNQVYTETGRIGLSTGDLTVTPVAAISGGTAEMRVQHNYPLLFGLLGNTTVPMDVRVFMKVL